MLSVSVIKNQKVKLLTGIALLITVGSFAQENSPYSRYGIGDLVPNASIMSRSMGGISAGLVDYDRRYDLKVIYPKSQAINFLNPASYSRMRITSFDLGFEVDNRTLRDPAIAGKFTSASAIISYIQLGVPISRKHNIGMTLGLRPVSRINYKIGTVGPENDPISHNYIDSVSTVYEGTGGSYQAYLGFGKAFKNLSIGFNTGYFFGTKDYSTRKVFIDSIDHYRSNHQTKATFGGLFFNAGAQYSIAVNKKTTLVLGVAGTLKQSFNAKQDRTVATFNYDANGAIFRIDSVFSANNVSGTVQMPASYTAGFTLIREDKWLFGLDYTTTKWSDYRYYGEKDALQDAWSVKAGGQFTPNPYDPKSYWSRVTYRFGFNFGNDYINLGKSLKQYTISAGAGFPVRKTAYNNQYTNINLGLEYGKRGNVNDILNENIFRISLGFTLSDLWFVKRKYE